MAAVREVKVICTPARGDVLSHIHHIESTNTVNQTDPRAVFVCIYYGVERSGWGYGLIACCIHSVFTHGNTHNGH